MKTITALVVIAGLLGASATYGQEKLTAQQQKMKTCNAEASDNKLRGDERRAFMSKCLKSDDDRLTSQQEKMQSCNREASRKDLKGDKRQDFMSECLRADRPGSRSSAAGR